VKRLLFSIAFTASLAFAAIKDPVKTESGLVSGVSGRRQQVRVFKGIPYAAAPVGDLRWRPPTTPAHWEGIRTAETFGHACIQDTNPPLDNPVYAWLLVKKGPRENTAEDCLFLNIWTAAKSANERLPVMVYIHGGGLVYGSGDEDLYNGDALVEKGVVYVNFNYRLGALGFLAHPELTRESEHHASGNYGFLDEIAALQWVQRNIAAFGGDPARVTVFGQSAGARSVNAMVASPLAKGLFRGVIAQSHGYFGGLGGVPKLADAEQAGLKFAKDAGASSLAELRALPAADVLKAQLQGRFRSNMNVDGWYMPDDVYNIFANGRQNDVAVIAGSDSDEASGHSKPLTAAMFIEQARRRFGNRTDEFLKFYPADSDAETMKSQIVSSTDLAGGYDARTFAQLQTRTGKTKAYLYLFSHRPPVAGPDTAVYDGVFHGAELYYLFQTYKVRSDWAWTDTDRKLGEMVSSYWVNFAKSGNPNGKGLPQWPVYNDDSQELLNFGDGVSAMPVPRRAALDLFESAFHPVGSSSRPASGNAR
jgi:para-nitrobenzyl esterase